MKKSDWIKAVCGYSILYTVATVLNSIIYLANGVFEDPSGNWHEIDRAIIVLIGVLALELCRKLKIKPLILRYIVAYIPTISLVFGYVWFRGLREELASTAYRDVWINFSVLFVIGCVILSIAEFASKKAKPKEK